MKNVFAHYFTWYSRKDTSGVWEHWNWDGPGTKHNPDNIIDGHEDVASVDVPIIGAYDSNDPRAHRYHLDLAEAAGIDAFCVDWYGSVTEENRNRDNIVDRNFSTMLESACLHRVKLCICYEEKILHDKTEEQIVETGKRHMKYIATKYFGSSGYWKSEERPVLIIWGNNRLPINLWNEMLKEIEPYNPWVIYSHHDHNPEYTKICHGFYPWVLLSDVAGQQAYLEEFYSTARRYLNDGRSTTMGAGVWPGFNDSGVTGWGEGSRIIPDKNDELYDLTWDLALRENPDWISITTWNDWNEGSNIEPGVKKGIKYLEKTAAHIARYKGKQSGIDISSVLKSYNL